MTPLRPQASAVGLLTPKQAAEFFGRRDPRTARRYLDELGVPVIRVGGGWAVRRVDIEMALDNALTKDRPNGPPGERVPDGSRLWDD